MREVWSLIPSEYRRGCLRVALLVPVKAVLDLVGVAALVPVMMLVLDPLKLQSSFLGRVSGLLNFTTDTGFTIFVILSVVLILLLKVFLSIAIINYQNRFLMRLYRNLSSRLFVSLYSRGLLYIKNQNSARMAFNVTGVCYNFVMGYLGGWMKLFGEIAFVILLFSALLFYSAGATIMAILAFLPVLLLYMLFVRKPLRDLGKRENDARREQNRLLYEAFKGYSEVQVNDAFPVIERRFRQGLDNISSYRIKSGIISSLPSYLLELSVVLIVAVFILFSVSSGEAADIVFMSIFAVSLLKLLPAVRGIMGAMSSLSATQYTKEVIAEIRTPVSFPLLHDDDIVPMQFDRSIRVEDVSFHFEDDEEDVISHLSFEIRKGVRFGIKGRTGAGKTTLFNILLGLYPPSGGRVTVDGVTLSSDNVGSWHRIVGYVPQNVFVADSTILENVALGFDPSSIDRDKAMNALRQASLSDFVAGLPNGIDTRIGEGGCKMSGGQCQRLGIARALYKNASILFFDEATSSLDSQTESEVNEAIAALSDENSGLTIIVISHRDSTMSFCDEILEL